MSSNLTNEKKIKIYKASKVLQDKAGKGTVSKEKIAEAQRIIEDNTVNFVPMANDYLIDLSDALKEAGNDDIALDQRRHNITLPIMQLKATGKIFGYKLIGDLSTLVLNFLETVKTVDEDVVSIINAHHQMTALILREQIMHDGGLNGETMKKELSSVCARYLKKNNIKKS